MNSPHLVTDFWKAFGCFDFLSFSGVFWEKGGLEFYPRTVAAAIFGSIRFEVEHKYDLFKNG